MAINIVVPDLGESIVEATVVRWHKKEGDPVAAGDVLVELETEKVNLDVSAETSGVLGRIDRSAGDDVTVGEVLGVIEDGAVGEAAPAAEEPATSTTVPPAESPPVSVEPPRVERGAPVADGKPAPAAAEPTPAAAAEQREEPSAQAAPAAREERVRLSRRRRTIARRLVEAQHEAAMLTTFNEVDMGAVMELRARHRDTFKERHGVKLGFMSFFVKAAVGGLKAFPRLNAELNDDTMVLKHHFDIGIAVDTEGGLVVPVVRDADQLSFAEIEKSIVAYATAAREGTLTIDALRGGTFTITNGGIFGSLLSTPILNPPQVGILGMHRIQERPVVVNGEIVVRPMMYVAISYDHRIVDGREAVQFLVRVKELIEDPERLLLES